MRSRGGGSSRSSGSDVVTAVVTAVAAERDAVADGIGDPQAVGYGPYAETRRCGTSGGDVLVIAGGVGPAAAAAAAAYAVATEPVGLLVSAGVAGAFPGLGHGSVVVASEIVAADLGVLSPERFLDLAELGLGHQDVHCDERRVADAAARLEAAGLPVTVGPVLTLSTMTGTAARARELMARHQAVAEAMEGSGVAHVARLHGVPVLELRTISNAVGERDRSGWDLLGALDALTRAAGALFRP